MAGNLQWARKWQRNRMWQRRWRWQDWKKGPYLLRFSRFQIHFWRRLIESWRGMVHILRSALTTPPVLAMRTVLLAWRVLVAMVVELLLLLVVFVVLAMVVALAHRPAELLAQPFQLGLVLRVLAASSGDGKWVKG